MAHITVRQFQTKAGLKWTATEAQWDNDKGFSVEKKLTPIVMADLGFSDLMTPTQAKDHAKKLNALTGIKRKEQRSKVRASERIHDLALVKRSIIPTKLSALFVDYIQENWFGGPYNLRKQVQHWAKVQTMLTAVKLQPHQYFKRKNDFYNYFKSKRMSKSYIEKLLKVLNLWGDFYSEEAKTYFKRVPMPRGIVLESIKDASTATGAGAAAMTVDTLNLLKGRLPEGQWEYMRATFWLGLRPIEMVALMNDKDKNLRIDSQDGIRIVGIYQSKLVGVSKDMRWKWIPLLYPEQTATLKDINLGLIKRPLVKTLRLHAPADAGLLALQSGRKGFTDLMLGLGQELQDISQWLGHASIERTWRHYKNKKRVAWTKVDSR